MIPIHPQPSPGHPDQLRWITPAGVLPCAGRLTAVPAPLAALLADGTLAELWVESAAVVTRLGPGRSWPSDGTRVRTAIHAALDDPAGWVPAAEAGDRPDDLLLYTAARDVIDGPVGQFARSHGGTIDLVEAHDGVVTVRLGGACRGCPAARVTMHQRLEHRLRQRYPGLREVIDLAAATAPRLPGMRLPARPTPTPGA
jgi:NFU1 iron-sulfur cluster scaffold homolog, mitochondrial